MNPATADLVKAVEAVPSREVVILPNNKNIRPVAERVDALSDKTVRVVATGSIVEGFAALLDYDPAAGADENVAAMTESAAHVVPAEITRAVRDSTTDAGEVHEGDYIGISRDGVVAVSRSRSAVDGDVSQFGGQAPADESRTGGHGLDRTQEAAPCFGLEQVSRCPGRERRFGDFG